MSSFFKKILCCGAPLLAFAVLPAQANVLLTFKVNNVTLNTCSGALQPSCSLTNAAGFQETVLLGSMPLGSPSDSSAGNVFASEASFGFPLARTGTPYTHILRDLVSGPVTDEQSLTTLDNAFDQDGAAGAASALIFSDLVSDTKDDLDVRRQQEYKLGYSLSAQFDQLRSYTDLVNESVEDFFSKFIGTMFGSYDELGTSAALDPLTLFLTDYAFLECKGDVTLVGVEDVDPAAVPEPGSLALVFAAALGMLYAGRRGASRLNAAPRV